MADEENEQPDQGLGRGRRLVRAMLRTSPSWTGAAVLCGFAALVLWLWRSSEQVLPGAGFASWRIMAVDLLLAAGVGLVVATIATLIGRLLKRSVPWIPAAVIVASAVLLGTMGAGASPMGWAAIAVLVVVTSCLVGGTVWALLAARRARTAAPGKARRIVTVVFAVVLVAAMAFLLLPGPGAPAMASPRTDSSLPDPTRPGTHEVVETAYGSGEDDLVPRYGSGVELRTEPVDASKIIGGWAEGSTRSGVWGFDASALPLNATVWSPAEDGRYPLVLVLHGNTSHADSELGFGYLGELLASRGYIVASVDESFLNTSVLDKSGGLTGASGARAWLLLQHLNLWSSWDSATSSPFQGQVDLDNVALVGHSRGGEAVAVAAEMARRGSVPELPDVDLRTDATIRTVVALAPSDGQGTIDRVPTVLEGVNYLTLAGSHDADVLTFAGSRQYARTVIGDGFTKAAVAIYRANHTQFNTEWGRYDVGLGLAKHVIDTAALLPAAEQQQAANVFVSAFLDLTMKNQQYLAPLFSDALPDAAWLPDTAYATRFARGDQSGVEGFAGSDDPAGPVLGTAETTGATATVVPLPSRLGASDNAVLRLAWDEPGTAARYTLTPAGDGLLAGAGHVVLAVADATPGGADRADVGMAVEVTDAAGETATVEIAGGLPPTMPGQLLKNEMIMPTPVSEPILQTYRIDLAAFAELGIAADSIASIAVVFESTAGDGVYLDDVGLAP